MATMRVLRLGLVLGLGLLLALCLTLIFGTDGEIPWVLGGVGGLVLAAPTAWGMIRMKRWSLVVSYGLAAAVLVLGCYAARFAWTFWIFREPSLGDRIRSVMEIRTLFLLLAPSLWLAYFLRPAVRRNFK
ncbi:MAG: hypothetical protein HQL11_06810 [Candidatus Omnitrophica bacterium]|nr:hypothetical protein [Candidatus Omnitrophota bacterium]